MKKKFLALLLTAVTVSSLILAGCGKEEEKKKEEVKKETLSPANLTFGADDYASVAKNDSYELKLNATASSIQVVELANGNVWDTQVSSESYDTKKVNKKWVKKLNSPFEISCTDLEGSFGDVLNYSLGELDYETTMEELENGVRVTYDISTISIKLAVDYVLTADGISVTIPESCLDEYGNNSVTSIKMFPYFAAATDTQDGYYFYPDGSGAIMEFKDISHFKESEVALNVYGNIFNYKEAIGVLGEQATEVLLPVFGAKIGDNGFVAIIEEGDEASQIKISSTNNIIPVNSLSCEFVYRRAFTDLRIDDGSKLTYDKERIDGDRTVSYRFLEQGNATYSDMANVYRDYLIETGVTAKKETETVPLYLDLFMAIKEDGFLVDPTVVATSFEEAEDILEELEEKGVTDIDLQLRGWTKNGYYTDPVQFPVNSKIGGSKGLENLLEYTTEKDMDVFLATNLLEAREEAGGFNTQNDVMYLGNSGIWNTYDGLYILSPDVSLNNYRKMEEKAAKFKISGMSMLSMGQYLVYNYNESNYITKKECMEMWQTIMNSSKEKFGAAVVEGGNAYVLGYADTIMDVPLTDSGYQITTKSVPFYQLAVHGLVNYTGKAGNLSSDLTKDTLKWVEYGYLPYFELTHSGSEELMYTDYNTLYTSTYSAWLDEAAGIYEDFNKNLTSVRNAYMESHTEIADDVFKVTYSNGETVYVNYNKEAVTVDGVTVEAENYVVKKG